VKHNLLLFFLPRIPSISAADYALINPQPGDEIVVSPTARTIEDASQVKPQCKSNGSDASGLKFKFNLGDCEPEAGYLIDEYTGVRSH